MLQIKSMVPAVSTILVLPGTFDYYQGGGQVVQQEPDRQELRAGLVPTFSGASSEATGASSEAPVWSSL